jgi:hypothetical protein
VVNHEREALKQAVRSVSHFLCFSRALAVDKDKNTFSSYRGGGAWILSMQNCFKPATSRRFDYTVRAQRHVDLDLP